MSRFCPIAHKGVLVGNNVSHANNKSKKRFLPNLQNASLLSDALGRVVKMRLSTRGLRTIEFHGGIDKFVMTTANRKLSPEILRLKKVIAKRLEAKSA